MDWTSAAQLAESLRDGTTSSIDLMEETYQRIEQVNPEVNAIVGLLNKDDALELARQADQVPLVDRGSLHGIPMAPKDSVQVKGFPTTFGFAPWANNIAQADDGLATRLRRAGALFIGHSNMPEFGLGSNTFNSVYGKTRNPYDLSKTAGGSSGGAAAALATRMLPLADGSDMGGSLRNPASFCNVVGFRPSIGRMPLNRGFSWMGRLTTTGPMASTVEDTALLFSAMAGPDQHDPLTLPESGMSFFDRAMFNDNETDLSGFKIAYAPGLHGIPIDTSVLEVLDEAASVFSNLGAQMSDSYPDLERAMNVFHTQRAANLTNLAKGLDVSTPDWRMSAKETAIWNIDKGFSLSSSQILQAELDRSEIYANVADFFETHDALLLPAAQVPPFDGDLEWPNEVNGKTMQTYIDWMEICCVITVTGLPTISIPAGFTPEGLPIGLQIVGKPRGDLELLRIAHRFEQATKHYKHLPEICAKTS